MALYAFDGTWNIYEEDASIDSNVVRFRDVYVEQEKYIEYLSGVGTKFSSIGKVFGGLFGFGGRNRIDEIYA